MRHDARSKTPRGIQTSTRKEYSHQLRDEQSETNTNRGKICGLVFLGGEHEDSEDE